MKANKESGNICKNNIHGKTMIITRNILNKIMDNRISDDCIIYLSGPSSLDTPLNKMRDKNFICVNGSAGHLIDNNIPIFIYVVCDGSFMKTIKTYFISIPPMLSIPLLVKMLLKELIQQRQRACSTHAFC